MKRVGSRSPAAPWSEGENSDEDPQKIISINDI